MLSRLRTWLAGLFGDARSESQSTNEDTTETEQTADEDTRICAVCYTPYPDAETCPLCGSTEFTTVGAEPEADGKTVQTQQRSGETTDDAAARLSELRDETEE